MFNDTSQYKQLHKEEETYGRGANVDLYLRLIKLLEKYDIHSVLEYGCGKGRLVEQLTKDGYEVTGYDPAVPTYATSEWENNPVDAVVSTDVFEHIDVPTLQKILNHFYYYQKPKLIFLHISCRKAHQILPNGENAHCTIMSKGAWLEFLKEEYPEMSWRVSYWNVANQGVDIVGSM